MVRIDRMFICSRNYEAGGAPISVLDIVSPTGSAERSHCGGTTLKRGIRRALLAALCFVAASCSSDATGTGGEGGLTLSLSTATLNVAQGGNGSVTATVSRTGGFDGPVSITVENLPANVTASAAPASIPSGSTSSAVTISAAAGATVGNTTLTIRASGSGVTARTATLTLNVTSSTAQGFSLALNPTSLSIQQGAQNTTTATLTRTGGFTGNVAFTATGAPAGVTVSFNPVSTPANTSTVTVAVGGAVAANTYPITIRGQGTGVPEQTATLSLTVTSAGGGTGSTTYRFCGQTVAFAATQDGSGPWTAATVTNNSVTFNMASGRGAVAYVVTPSGTSSGVVVLYGTRAEMHSTAACPTPPATKTLTGSVANVSVIAGEYAGIAMGGGSATVNPFPSANFTLNNVPTVATDLIAGRIAQTLLGGGGFTAVMNKGIIRRGLNPAAGSVLPVLDFNAAEAFTPVTRTITFASTNGEVLGVSVAFLTGAGTTTSSALGILSDFSSTASTTRQYPAVPNTQAGDIHGITAFTIPTTGAVSVTRGLIGYYKDGLDRTLTFGPSIAATFTSSGASSNVRVRSQHTVVPEYNQGFAINLVQNAAGTNRSWNLNVFPSYLSGATSVDVTTPDFSGLAGWNGGWNLLGTHPITSIFTGTGGSVTGLLDGSVTRTGTVTQTINLPPA